jgi:hypothetical protein
MGVAPNVGFDQWPRQGEWLGHRARVCFHYESREVMGTIVRDDQEEPFRTIISLDDGRVVLATECMFSPFTKPEPRQ